MMYEGKDRLVDEEMSRWTDKEMDIWVPEG